MKREALVPIDEEIAGLIGEQQQRGRERHPAGTPFLFPRPNANIDGARPSPAAPTATPSAAGWPPATSATSTASPPA